MEYPAYSLPFLVNYINSFLTSCIIHLLSFRIFEEVRMTIDIDAERNVELFLPALFEKVLDNSMFISDKIMFSVDFLTFLSDVLPIRLIKLLYQYFKDPAIHVLTEMVISRLFLFQFI